MVSTCWGRKKVENEQPTHYAVRYIPPGCIFFYVNGVFSLST